MQKWIWEQFPFADLHLGPNSGPLARSLTWSGALDSGKKPQGTILPYITIYFGHHSSRAMSASRHNALLCIVNLQLNLNSDHHLSTKS